MIPIEHQIVCEGCGKLLDKRDLSVLSHGWIENGEIVCYDDKPIQYTSSKRVGDNVTKGMVVYDADGNKGTVRDCKDLHNVHVTLDGEGLTIDWYGVPFECAGTLLCCLAKDCEDNTQEVDPLYYHSKK